MRWTKTKTTVYALVSIYKGDLDEGNNFEVEGTYVIKEKRFSEALDNAKHLDVFNDEIEDDNKNYKMPDGKKEIPHLFIKREDVPFTRSWDRSVATCAYNATNEYLQHWLGRKFDHNDKKWYSQHHLVTPDGLPQEFTFTVLQQLVEPYGCGIKGIQVPRNTRRFPEHNTFIAALGANPFYKLDGHTTNEEAYEKMFPEVALMALGHDTPAKKAKHKKEQFAQWRFECVDFPELGAICMKQFQLKSVGHNGGSNYYGPRANFRVGNDDQWLMAIKMDELSKLTYFAEPELPEYKVYEGNMKPQWWSIKDGHNGKTIRELAPKVTYSTSSGTSSGSGTTKSKYFTDPLYALGYSAQEVQRMSWKTARELKDGGIKGAGILILSNGDWKPLRSSEGSSSEDKPQSQVPLLTDKSKEDKVLAYPPTCEECQKSPGNTVFNGEMELLCENCGTKVPTFEVPVSYILDGWEPVEQELYGLGLDDDDCENPFDFGDENTDPFGINRSL